MINMHLKMLVSNIVFSVLSYNDIVYQYSERLHIILFITLWETCLIKKENIFIIEICYDIVYAALYSPKDVIVYRINIIINWQNVWVVYM